MRPRLGVTVRILVSCTSAPSKRASGLDLTRVPRPASRQRLGTTAGRCRCASHKSSFIVHKQPAIIDVSDHISSFIAMPLRLYVCIYTTQPKLLVLWYISRALPIQKTTTTHFGIQQRHRKQKAKKGAGKKNVHDNYSRYPPQSMCSTDVFDTSSSVAHSALGHCSYNTKV